MSIRRNSGKRSRKSSSSSPITRKSPRKRFVHTINTTLTELSTYDLDRISWKFESDYDDEFATGSVNLPLVIVDDPSINPVKYTIDFVEKDGNKLSQIHIQDLIDMIKPLQATSEEFDMIDKLPQPLHLDGFDVRAMIQRDELEGFDEINPNLERH